MVKTGIIFFQTVPEVEDLEDEELESNDRQHASGSLSSNGSSLEPCFSSSRSRRPGEREADSQSKNNIDHLLLQVARQVCRSEKATVISCNHLQYSKHMLGSFQRRKATLNFSRVFFSYPIQMGDKKRFCIIL